MLTQRTILGLEAETAVATYLSRGEFKILDRNWQRPWGELDIVAIKGGVIHFIEVKASQKMMQGFEPAVRADWKKMAKVKRTAQSWLAHRRYSDETEWQMDVASVIMSANGPEIELFENV